MIISRLRDPVPDLIRTTDKRFLELDLDPNAYTSVEEVIGLLLVHPELMQRPVVVKGDRAVIARPGDSVAEIFGSVRRSASRDRTTCHWTARAVPAIALGALPSACNPFFYRHPGGWSEPVGLGTRSAGGAGRFIDAMLRRRSRPWVPWS
jgi:ArsC family